MCLTPMPLLVILLFTASNVVNEMKNIDLYDFFRNVHWYIVIVRGFLGGSLIKNLPVQEK